MKKWRHSEGTYFPKDRKRHRDVQWNLIWIQQAVSHGWTLKVVLGGSPRCPDNHDLSKYHRLYDLVRHIEQP